MSAAKKPVNGDRVRVGGRDGTLVDIHTSGSWLVLYDDGPKEASVTEPGERTGPRRTRGKPCDRCAQPGHHAFYCPKGST